ncbi:MAG: hypothetical protein RML94_14785, partial [Bacteroidia bacterium]|nr:hypothetical protein [Bacteroidia bacterium]
QGVGGWGVAPLARSTPTRSAAKGHAQKIIFRPNISPILNFYRFKLIITRAVLKIKSELRLGLVVGN